MNSYPKKRAYSFRLRSPEERYRRRRKGGMLVRQIVESIQNKPIKEETMKMQITVTASVVVDQKLQVRFGEGRGIVAGEYLRDENGDWHKPVRHTSVRDGDMVYTVSSIPLFDGFELAYTGEDAKKMDKLAGKQTHN